MNLNIRFSLPQEELKSAGKIFPDASPPVTLIILQAEKTYWQLTPPSILYKSEGNILFYGEECKWLHITSPNSEHDIRLFVKVLKMIHAFVPHHVEREHNCVFENSSFRIYFRNKIDEYLFATHLITQSIFTAIFANIGIISLPFDFCTGFLGLP